MKTRLLHLSVLLTLMVLLAGCSAETARAQFQRVTAQIRDARNAQRLPVSAESQLLVLDGEGNLALVDAGSGVRIALTSDASPRRQYLQPTWSADGERIAWSRRDGAENFLETSRFDGTDRSALSVPFLPFYMFWSPTGDRLAYLSNWLTLDQPSMALRVVEFGENDDAVRTLSEGQPFYFSWAPDGERLVTHIGNERIELLSVDGDAQSLRITGGVFPAPQWAQDGARLVYAIADTARQRLIVTDLAGAELAELTDYAGRVAFSLSPDDTRLAYVVTEPDTQASTLGALYVVNVDTLQTREVTGNPVLAFFWSPTGDKLAYLALEVLGARLGVRWYVWDGQKSTPFAGFLPTRTFLESYVPFFDQYAQSHRIWSPDGRAFVFTGTLPDGRSGVWVQDVEVGSEPRLVGPGVFATWSPR